MCSARLFFSEAVPCAHALPAQPQSFAAFRKSLVEHVLVPNASTWEFHFFYFVKLPDTGYNQAAFFEDATALDGGRVDLGRQANVMCARIL